MKRLILIVVVSLMLLTGGGGGYHDGLVQDARAEPADPAERMSGEPVYIEFNPILLPIVGEDDVDQFINIVIALEMPDQEAADRAISMAPRLNDAYLIALYGTLHSSDVMHNGIVDLPLINRRLVEESNRVLGAGSVHDALIQMVSQRIM